MLTLIVAGSAAERVSRDHDALDLGRAFVQRGDARVAVQALDLVFAAEAVAAEDLHRLVGAEVRGLAREQLGHRALGAGGLTLGAQRRGLPHHQARRLDPAAHVGDLELDRLEVGDGLAERDALVGVADREIQRALRDAERLRRDADAAAVERGHGDGEALALFVEHVLRRDLKALEEQLGRARAVDAHLLFDLADREAGPGLLDDERADALVAQRRILRGVGDADARLRAVRDPHLAAGQREATRGLGGAGLERGGVGAGLGLGERVAADGLTRRELGQVLLLLRGVAELQDGPAGEAVLHRHDDADARVRVADLFEREHVGQRVHAGAAVLDRGEHAHQAELAKLRDDVDRELARLVARRRAGEDLVAREFTRHVADGDLLVGEVKHLGLP